MQLVDHIFGVDSSQELFFATFRTTFYCLHPCSMNIRSHQEDNCAICQLRHHPLFQVQKYYRSIQVLPEELYQSTEESKLVYCSNQAMIVCNLFVGILALVNLHCELFCYLQ